MLVSQREGGVNTSADLTVTMNIVERPYHIYKNSPICSVCQKPMVYLYTDIKRWKSFWKCRDCNTHGVTIGYPEEDEGDPSKRPTIFVSLLESCEYIIMPGDDYENRRIRENYLRLQDKQTEISGRGSREQISTIYALHL
uniref:Uncharacterized protein n=1 Tax=viral metagenome TaxID=1070528 RepID=A0A6M3IV48_9ZZZZ